MKQLTNLLVILLLISSCTKKEEPQPLEPSKEILHISHTKTDQEGEIVDLLKDIDFSQYELICHGGDVDQKTSKDENIISAWDELFNFSADRTLWALGNHDVTNRDLIQQYTNRPSFYTYNFEKTTFLVLDTHLNESIIDGEQLDLFNNVCDTISSASNLVILTHLLFWMPDNEQLEPRIDSVANGKFGTCFYCTKSNNFYDDLYPKLKEVKDRGIQVLCIAGDLGARVNEFEHQTEEGIFFLASGLDFLDSDNDDQVLILQHNNQTGQLEWQFKLIESI